MGSRRQLTVVAALAALLLIGFAAGCGSSDAASDSGGLEVREATIDQPANPQQAAMRLVIRNDTDTDDALLGASSPRSKSATIHRTTEDAEGRTSMEMLKRLDIPAGKQVTFDPSTYHVMLEGFAQPLKIGDEVPVTFTFEKAGEQKVMAKVIEAGTAGMEHDMDHSTDMEHDHG